MVGPLAVLCDGGSQEYGRYVFKRRQGGGMNIKRVIGLDNLAGDYAYARDAETGYTSAKRIPSHWVATTCGYCSVGCGMEIGVRENKAVAVRPLESHPVNRGKLCPK